MDEPTVSVAKLEMGSILIFSGNPLETKAILSGKLDKFMPLVNQNFTVGTEMFLYFPGEHPCLATAEVLQSGHTTEAEFYGLEVPRGIRQNLRTYFKIGPVKIVLADKLDLLALKYWMGELVNEGDTEGMNGILGKLTGP